MTRFEDELDYVCAWGRWRIGQALNEPVLSWSGERRCVEHRMRQRVQKPARGLTTGTSSPLHLVTDAGRPVTRTPGSSR